jgi:hypothetical protein
LVLGRRGNGEVLDHGPHAELRVVAVGAAVEPEDVLEAEAVPLVGEVHAGRADLRVEVREALVGDVLVAEVVEARLVGDHLEPVPGAQARVREVLVGIRVRGRVGDTRSEPIEDLLHRHARRLVGIAVGNRGRKDVGRAADGVEHRARPRVEAVHVIDHLEALGDDEAVRHLPGEHGPHARVDRGCAPDGLEDVAHLLEPQRHAAEGEHVLVHAAVVADGRVPRRGDREVAVDRGAVEGVAEEVVEVDVAYGEVPQLVAVLDVDVEVRVEPVADEGREVGHVLVVGLHRDVDPRVAVQEVGRVDHGLPLRDVGLGALLLGRGAVGPGHVAVAVGARPVEESHHREALGVVLPRRVQQRRARHRIPRAQHAHVLDRAAGSGEVDHHVLGAGGKAQVRCRGVGGAVEDLVADGARAAAAGGQRRLAGEDDLVGAGDRLGVLLRRHGEEAEVGRGPAVGADGREVRRHAVVELPDLEEAARLLHHVHELVVAAEVAYEVEVRAQLVVRGGGQRRDRKRGRQREKGSRPGPTGLCAHDFPWFLIE